MADDFSNEGLYRLLERMDREHGDDLKEIRKQTTETNSRVVKLETRVDRSDVELKRLNSAVFQKASSQLTPASLPVTTTTGESIQITFSKKVWAGIVAATAFLSPIIYDWLKSLLERP